MEIVQQVLVYVWLFGTYFVFAAALFLAVAWRSGSASTRRRCLILCLAVALAMVLVNPLSNHMIFAKHREQVVATMLTAVGESTASVTEKYGEPDAVYDWDGRDYWRYSPGPWYVLMPWEEVVYQVRDGRVLTACIDD